jgi:uncharacterized protein involved in exopolysaccharide biosynthesis
MAAQAESKLLTAEGLDVVELAREVWSRRLWILAGTMATTILGLVYAYTTPSVYRADAIIAPKESKGSGGNIPFLPGIGSLGGLVMQMGASNTNVDRLDLMIRSRDLARLVIEENHLLPELFPKSWDAAKKEWKAGSHAPSMRDGMELLRSSMLNVVVQPKKSIITVSIASGDSTFSARLVRLYLIALNKKIQSEVRQDADSNRQYLENQLSFTSDPLLREKIQGLIGMEIERAMLVSSKSFDILENPIVPNIRERPKRRRILIVSVFAGMILSLTVACFWKGVTMQISRFRGLSSERAV